MKFQGEFKPTYTHRFSTKWLLWFKKSNFYNFVDPSIKEAITIYLNAPTFEVFNKETKNLKAFQTKQIEAKQLYDELGAYLKQCNTVTPTTHECAKPHPFDASCCVISNHYDINGTPFEVHYDDPFTVDLLHHTIAQYTSKVTRAVPTRFYVYAKEDHLYLYKNEQLLTCVSKHEYHYIQGKFAMHLFCTIHDFNESDWIGTLHASTVALNNKAMMLIGDSGSGKSTLTAILTASGFELVADDLSPIHEKDAAVYYNPNGISIKKGAFDILSPYYKAIKQLPTLTLSDYKGAIKYLPIPLPKNRSYPCNHMILVAYNDNATTTLTKIPADEALRVLIPESWLSKESKHAKAFIAWLTTIQYYKLSYSNNKEAVARIKKLNQETIIETL